MTRIQKTILIVLSVTTILLSIGLIVLYRQMKPYIGNETAPSPTSTEFSQLPIVEIEMPGSTASKETPAPTALPVVEIHIPAPGETPEVTAYPITDEPFPTTTPTREPAYVYMPTSAPMNTPVPTVPSGMAFTLSILGKTIHVAPNVEAETLEKTPGWLPTSVKPGKEGTCVVYGHRNRNHLLILKEIEIGDEIDVILPDGKVYTYVVEKTEILDSEESLHIPTTTGKHMVLMTCYPFYYSGHAPKKFIVTGSLVEQSRF